MGDIVIRVRYPLAAEDRIALRTDQDWNANLEPEAVSGDRTLVSFRFPSRSAFHYFKPVLFQNGQMHWSQGNNYLALGNGGSEREIYPYFFGDSLCSVCALRELERGSQRHQFRIFYPPGYAENHLKRYPVLYMQDGQNLFFADEAFSGTEWKIDETLFLLDQMNVVDKMIVVGIYPQDRLRDYTLPGYENYGRFLVELIKPYVDANFRTLKGPENTAVMGSSLGGVVSFYLAWQYPDIFGMAACMSSSFGYRDDLRARVEREPKRPVRFYLDSGWPQDNYEVTRDLRTLLLRRGYDEGHELFYLAFPDSLHHERFWGLRAHIPIQLLFGWGRPSPTPAGGDMPLPAGGDSLA